MLAIVIPYYRITFFAETLQSLANQTDKRFFVYIGDDGSPDNPELLLQKFNGQFNFQYKRFEENLGSKSLVRQWDRCIDMTRDEQWLMILGDDDVLEPNCIAAFYEKAAQIDSGKIKVVRYFTKKINGKSDVISGIYEHPELETAPDFLIRKYKERSRSSLSEYIFDRKTVLEKKFRDFPLAWHSDELAVMEFSGFGTILTLEAIVNVRVSEASISGKKDNLAVKDKATQLFFISMMDNIGHFNRMQQDEILCHAEKVYLRNKKSIGYFIKILSFYLVRARFAAALRFIKSTIGSFYLKYHAGRE